MMRAQESQILDPAESEIFTYLLFSVTGIRFGVDTQQVSAILERQEAEDVALPCIAADAALSIEQGVVAYHQPKVLLIRHADRFGLLVDSPEEIVDVTIDALRPLPELWRTARIETPIWGVLLYRGDIVLLIDSHKITR